MDIKPSGSVPSRRAPAESFTGTVWQDPIIEAPAPARLRGAFVRFEPRARTVGSTISSMARRDASGVITGAGE